ncbi:agmatine deiminase family protein [Rubritalea tangerina]|uniref:Agmatine/peptidylarginine deiminase n=1 Tax=Rubritalea tangerina TaxID=430798 RepID=A0ABW4ZER8_9BACT
MNLHTPETYWPAEWHPQDAVWFSWPHRNDTWPEQKLIAIQQQFASLITQIARFQPVSINAHHSLHKHIQNLLTQKKCELSSITLHHHPTNDVWCRDHGATFTINRRTNKLRAVDWHFNAWGGKFPPWDLDDKVAASMALSVAAEHYRSPLYLEGGAIEGNGEGVLITTEAVALNPNRNPDWTKNAVEQELKQALGVTHIFWLPSGIEGDDTDGHIDDLTRFVQPEAIVTAVETNSKDPNYHTLQRNLEMLQDLKSSTGSSIETIPLPMPTPLRASDWRLNTLPASYANFLIINDAVIVPTFDQHKQDDQALGILRECFPNRTVLGFDCRDLIWEGGAIHCISQQQPSPTL